MNPEDVKLSQKSRQLLKTLDTIKEVVHYYIGGSDDWSKYSKDFADIEDFLIEASKSRKLHDAELAKKILEKAE